MGPSLVLSLLPVQNYTCNKLIFRRLSDSVLQVTHLLTPPLVRQRPPELGLQGGRRCGAALRCLRPGLGRGPRRSRPLRPAPGPRARAMGLWLPPPPTPPG